MTGSPAAPMPEAHGMGQVIVALFKLRIVALLLVAAMAGAFLASDGRPGGREMLVLVLAGAASAGGASALNEYFERGRDALMQRTRRRRPLATGAIARPAAALMAGVSLATGAVVLTLPFNPILSLFLFLGAFIYVVIYTLWLKPRTSLNIVVGGMAGSCAVLSGSAAVHAWADPGALLLALMLFLWTPIHFWSLAMVYREDYARVGVPMLPVQATPRTAAAWSLAHGVGAGATACLLALWLSFDPIYLAPALAMTALLIGRSVQLVITPSSNRAWQVFHTSNIFLLVVLLAACLASVVQIPRF